MGDREIGLDREPGYNKLENQANKEGQFNIAAHAAICISFNLLSTYQGSI
jgi:hypothetical protein